MSLSVSLRALAAMRAAAGVAHPHECCGLLLGEGTHIHSAQPAENVAADPARHFAIDPAALIAAHRRAREGGPALIGYYHSHPGGGVRPSATDRAQASGDGRVWAIVGGEEIAFWRDGAQGFEALSTSEVAA